MPQKRKMDPVVGNEEKPQPVRKPQEIGHYTETNIGRLHFDHAIQWRKDNPVDNMDIAEKTDEGLRNELTRGDIRESRRRTNFAKTFDHLLEDPAFSELKSQLEKCYASLPDEQRRKKVRDQIAETAQVKGVRLNNAPTGAITKEELANYRRDNPKHAEWVDGLSRERLELTVALRRMKSSLRLNSSPIRRLASKIEAQYPEIMAKIKERFSKITEPFRSVQTNKVVLATGISLGIKP